jgi:hypothetical protein
MCRIDSTINPDESCIDLHVFRQPGRLGTFCSCLLYIDTMLSSNHLSTVSRHFLNRDRHPRATSVKPSYTCACDSRPCASRRARSPLSPLISIVCAISIAFAYSIHCCSFVVSGWSFSLDQSSRYVDSRSFGSAADSIQRRCASRDDHIAAPQIASFRPPTTHDDGAFFLLDMLLLSIPLFCIV